MDWFVKHYRIALNQNTPVLLIAQKYLYRDLRHYQKPIQIIRATNREILDCY